MNTRTRRRLTAATAAVLSVSASVGLLVEGVYTDPPTVTAMYRGYDLTSLALVVPLLLATLPSRRAERPTTSVVQAGLLVHVAYTAALYVFGTAFNDLLLLHVATFTLALAALVASLTALPASVHGSSSPGFGRQRTAAVLLALLGVGLGGMWIAGAAGFVTSGQLPAEGSQLVLPVNLTHLAYVLDLGLLVPAYMVAAVWLWRGRVRAWSLAAALFVGGIVSQLGYMVALAVQAGSDIPGAVGWDPVEPVIVAVYALGAWLTLGRQRTAALPTPSAGAPLPQP